MSPAETPSHSCPSASPSPAAAPHRARTRVLHLGPVTIGGGHPVAVQSMTNTDTRDPEATLAQIERLARAGC